jgi:hypothetical protein
MALARDGLAVGDTLILAGPGGQYGILTMAPSGTVMSVDGDPVDGYYPVSYDGISGWTAVGLLRVADGGGGNGAGNGGGGGGNNNRGNTSERGNGGTETVTAAPIFTEAGHRSRRHQAPRLQNPSLVARMAPAAAATANSRSSTSSTRPPPTTVSRARTCYGWRAASRV